MQKTDHPTPADRVSPQGERGEPAGLSYATTATREQRAIRRLCVCMACVALVYAGAQLSLDLLRIASSLEIHPSMFGRSTGWNSGAWARLGVNTLGTACILAGAGGLLCCQRWWTFFVRIGAAGVLGITALTYVDSMRGIDSAISVVWASLATLSGTAFPALLLLCTFRPIRDLLDRA
ncbi:MAG: hypothetical protein QM770_14655 [Tepidisphaeraceae bacterium]